MQHIPNSSTKFAGKSLPYNRSNVSQTLWLLSMVYMNLGEVLHQWCQLRTPRMFVILNRFSTIFKMLKLLVGVSLTHQNCFINKNLFQHLMCLHFPLPKYKIWFATNSLFIQVIMVASSNTTNWTSQKTVGTNLPRLFP